MSEELPASWKGYCDKPCNGPIFGRSRLHLAISHAAYWLWTRMPYWIALGKIGMAILPRAGDIAFACSCRDKNDAARATRTPIEGDS